MKNKLKKWEISLIIGFVAALLFGAAGAGAQTELNDKLVRLHVAAASDSEEDQARKNRVRDEALRFLQEPLDSARDADDAMSIIEARLPELQENLEAFLAAEGSYQTIDTALLPRHSFPTRHYDTFALPAGQYKTLLVTLDGGGGRNWWCVVFPPLCAATAMEELEDVSHQAGLTDEDFGLITQENEEYVIKFKVAEWFGAVRNWFAGT